MFNYLKTAMKTTIFHQCVFMMNQKHVFGYRFLVTNRNVFEGHENTPQVTFVLTANLMERYDFLPFK